MKALHKFFNIRQSTNKRAPQHIQKQIMEKAAAKRQRKLARCSLDGVVGWRS